MNAPSHACQQVKDMADIADLQVHGRMPILDLTLSQVGLTDVTQYEHRVGRTGRAGKTGQALLLLADDEAALLPLLAGMPLVAAAGGSDTAAGQVAAAAAAAAGGDGHWTWGGLAAATASEKQNYALRPQHISSRTNVVVADG